jgi:ethanolamine-phosphate cytidylyltransferase
MDSSISELISSLPSLYASKNSSEIDDSFLRSHLTEIVTYLNSIPRSPLKKAVRVLVGPCMDLIHSGHFNFLRQAKSLGDVLVVGVIADEEILRAKGPTVMNLEERTAVIEACKWVDEVHPGIPYVGNLALLERFNCEYLVHGDDLAIRKDTGQDALAEVRQAGRLKIVKRTEGVSTTEMVGRMLLMTSTPEASNDIPPTPVSKIIKDPGTSSLLASTRRISQFASNNSPPTDARVVYVDGAFDLLHMGHINTLKAASALGNYLIVGVHDDKTVHSHKGKNFPIMNLNERCLNLLALKYVDDVIMGAPWAISEDMIKTLNIAVVVQGSYHKLGKSEEDVSDPYELPKRMGIYVEVESAVQLDTERIIQRIIANRNNYVERNQRCVEKETNYYENKTYVREI